MKEVLIAGGAGQVGRALAAHRWPEGWRAVALCRADLDLCDLGAVVRVLAKRRWAAVVNAAGYTAVDQAEAEPAKAWAVNALGPATLAQACRDAGLPLVHVSTDYVFDGSRSDAWEVDDPVGPLNAYGASKLGGEIALRATHLRHAIVRTSWVVSAQGTNFVRTMLRLGAERSTVRVVADQRGAPTAAADLAGALAAITVRLADDPDAPTGTFHFANTGATTWHGVAEAVFRGVRDRGGRTPILEPIATADYPTLARRPANSLLSTRALEQAFGIARRPWTQAVDDILADLIGPKP